MHKLRDRFYITIHKHIVKTSRYQNKFKMSHKRSFISQYPLTTKKYFQFISYVTNITIHSNYIFVVTTEYTLQTANEIGITFALNSSLEQNVNAQA